MKMMETMTNRVRAVGLALALPVVLALGAAPGAAQETQEYPTQEDPRQQMQQEGEDLISVAEQAGNLTLFVQAVRGTGLQEALQEGPFTVFAPTDEAFREHFSEEELNRLFGAEAVQKAKEKEGEERATYPQRGDETQPRPTDDPMDPKRQGQEGQETETGHAQEYGQPGHQATQEDQEKLLTVLRTHLVMGDWTVDQLRNRDNVQNILGAELAIEDGAATGAEARGEMPVRDDEDMRGQERAERQDQQDDMGFQQAGRELGPEESLRIGDAEIVRADLRASNGVIHTIDAVLEQSEMDEMQQDETRQPGDEEEQEDTPETEPNERDSSPSGR